MTRYFLNIDLKAEAFEFLFAQQSIGLNQMPYFIPLKLI